MNVCNVNTVEIEMKSLADGDEKSPNAEASGEPASSAVVEIDGSRKSVYCHFFTVMLSFLNY